MIALSINISTARPHFKNSFSPHYTGLTRKIKDAPPVGLIQQFLLAHNNLM
jgi:hypothetical protein